MTFDGPAEFFSGPGGVLDVGMEKKDAEFLAAIAAEDITLSDSTFEGSGDGFEDAITGSMTVAVVDRLEVVDVHHEESDGIVVPLGAAPGDIGLLEERTPVQTAGERVTGGENLELLVLLLDFLAGIFEGDDHFLELGIAAFDLANAEKGDESSSWGKTVGRERSDVHPEIVGLIRLGPQVQEHTTVSPSVAKSVRPREMIRDSVMLGIPPGQG